MHYCSPDEDSEQHHSIVLAVANERFDKHPGPLMVLLIDEEALDAPVRWEPAAPTPPPGTPPGVLFPHVYGPINRTAVVGMLEVRRDVTGQWATLAPWS